MKIWWGYGSEHSMRLVMIGHFKAISDATKAKQVIDEITKQIQEDVQHGLVEVGDIPAGYSEGLMELLRKFNVYSIGTGELEQFVYDLSVSLDSDKVTITTDEADVSAFLKILVENGARVEVFSAHFYPPKEKTLEQ